MAYRFVLEVPELIREDAKVAVESVGNARILVERHPHLRGLEEARADLTITAQTLDVVDTIYRWMVDRGITAGVYLDAYKGGQIDLSQHDAKSLRAIIQGSQYWYENTIPRVHYIDQAFMEGGARVSDVPYGGRTANSLAIQEAEHRVTLGTIDHVAVRVRDMTRAEKFYSDFFGMNVIYRARREGERWQHLPATFTWEESVSSGVMPEIVRMENGPVSLVLINAGGGAVMHENRVAYISVDVPLGTLNDLRGRALFSSYTVQEDSPRAFRFVDPFGVTWQLVSNE